MKKLVIIALIVLCPLSVVYAQKDSTLNRTVVVENEYNPTIMDASKINVLPKIEEPKVTKKEAEYATALKKNNIWNYEPMSPIERPIVKEMGTRGYATTAYGNYGNVDLGLGYLWDITSIDRLNVNFLLKGMNGDIHKTGFNRDGDWPAHHYTTHVVAGYDHLFEPVSMNLGGSFTSQVFNYLSPDINDEMGWVGTYRQHHTFGDFNIGLASRDKGLPFQFKVQTGLKFFGQKYNMLGEGIYESNKEDENILLSVTDDTNEKIIHTEGDLWTNTHEEQSFGMEFGMDNLFYSNSLMHNYTSVLLNPYYKFEDDNWRIRLGLHADWFSGDEGGVNVAPNLKAEYIFSDSYIFYVNADGGRQLNEYRKLNGVSRYWLMDSWLEPTYTVVDASIGLRASPMNGLWFNVYGGYRIREHETFAIPVLRNSSFYVAKFLQDKANVAYVGGEIRYSYKDWFDLGVNTSYWNWSINGLEEYDDDYVYSGKSKFIFDLHGKGKVFEGLYVDGGFYYVKRCGDFLNDVNDLHVGAEYEFIKHISVFAHIHNILNKEYDMVGYPEEKLNFLVGFKARF